MNKTTTISLAGVLGALAVMLGAFGAHALEAPLAAKNLTDTYQTAVQYHFYHTLALLVTGLLMGQQNSKKLRWAALLFAVGILFFSGSLYVLCLTGVRVLGAITPIGGVLFIAGWVLLAIDFAKK